MRIPHGVTMISRCITEEEVAEWGDNGKDTSRFPGPYARRIIKTINCRSSMQHCVYACMYNIVIPEAGGIYNIRVHIRRLTPSICTTAALSPIAVREYRDAKANIIWRGSFKGTQKHWERRVHTVAQGRTKSG